MNSNVANHNEVIFDKNSIIVIRLTTQGVITYVNDDFLKVSGFNRDEILGQNYNAICHSEMPTKIMDDCFESLSSIHPWTGFLKNRTKSGHFYWTHTNAIAEFDKGVLSSYLFVSFALKKNEREQAEKLYSQIAQNQISLKKASRHILDNLSITKKLTLSLIATLSFSAFAIYNPLLSQDYNSLFSICFLSVIALTNIYSAYKSNAVLDSSIVLFYRLADKKFGNQFDLKKSGLIGDFYRGLFSMDVSLSLDIAESNRRNNENLRITHALNSVHSAVMVADLDYNIIFHNESAFQLFKDCETQLKQKVPNFEISQILGSNIDIFHVNPEKQRALLSNLTGNYEADIILGEHIMTTSTTVVLNKQGEKIGFVTEWIDKTNEVKTIQAINNAVEAASLGNFDIRISENGQHGFLLELSHNLNQLLESVSVTLKELDLMLEGLSKGDLTQTITKDYQGIFGRVKNSVNTATENLRNIITEIKETTDIISSSTKEIAFSNNELAQRTEETASNIEKTATSMQELITTVQHNNENANLANDLAGNATKTAFKGVSVIEEQVVETMRNIKESSLRVIDIISVIDDIAFQTNILALNAAVEAARAGELGQGFAVVATEVRNLAQRSAHAAGEIKLLINNSVERVALGDQQVTVAGVTMREIANSIENVSNIITEITCASTQQSVGVSQIGKSISSVDNATQQNAAMTTKMATSVEDLERQTNHLKKEMLYFKTKT